MNFNYLKMSPTITGAISLFVCLSWVNVCLAEPEIDSPYILKREPFPIFGKVYEAKQCGGNWNITTVVGQDCVPSKTCERKLRDGALHTQIGFIPADDVKQVHFTAWAEDEDHKGGRPHQSGSQLLFEDIKKGKTYTLDFHAYASEPLKFLYKIYLKHSDEDVDYLCVQAIIQFK